MLSTGMFKKHKIMNKYDFSIVINDDFAPHEFAVVDTHERLGARVMQFVYCKNGRADDI